jgi:hypothetical protein
MSKGIGAWSSKVGLLAALLCLGTGSALADPSFNIAGSTTGQFYLLGLLPQDNASGMTFAGVSSFSTPSNSSTPFLLGTFDAPSLGYFDPYTFKLSVKFTAPSVPGTSFSAEVDGTILWGLGSATIDFNDSGPRRFNFSTAQGSGYFDLTITDKVKVTNSVDGKIWGTISNATFAATPEPAAIVLTSALFGGVLLLFRKKLKIC